MMIIGHIATAAIGLVLVSTISAPAAEVLVPTRDGDPYLMYINSRALVVAQSDYQSATWPDLTGVQNETARVSEALEEQGFTVELASDLDSTTLPAKIRSFLLKRTDKATRSIIYFAGHGYSEPSQGGSEQGYIVPVDAVDVSDPDLTTNLLNFADIVGWARRSPSKHVLLVFNSCFSGAILAVRRNSNPPVSTLILNDVDRYGLQYISAGSAYEPVPDQSQFAGAFILGMQGEADRNGDSIVTASELGSFVRDSIIPEGIQTPQYASDLNIDRRLGDMVFVHSSTPSEASTGAIVLAGLSGPRAASVRAIAEPTAESGTDFKGVEIVYFKKTVDGNKVLEALDKDLVPYLVTNTVLPNYIPTNAVACGPDIQPQALRSLLTTLIRGGVPIRKVFQFMRPTEKPSRIEVLSLAKQNGTVEIDTPLLTIEQINGLDGCPVSLGGIETVSIPSLD